jgi:hypothetical protein
MMKDRYKVQGAKTEKVADVQLIAKEMSVFPLSSLYLAPCTLHLSFITRSS